VTDGKPGDAAVAQAFGKPGIAPTWTSSAKDMVVTGLGRGRMWATLGHGILNEVYWPVTGQPQIRGLGFIVAGDSWWAEVKRVNTYQLSLPEPYVPLPKVVHQGDRYRLTLEFLADPDRDVLLISFQLDGDNLRLYPLLAPHLGISGWNNTAWVEHGLLAGRDNRSVCLMSSTPFTRASAGYVGYSDGWQDFSRNGRMTQTFARAEDGNVALMGEVVAADGVLALGFAETPEGARTLAASSLAEGYPAIRGRFLTGWQAWGKQLRLPESTADLNREANLSACVLRVHEDRTYPGALIASLAIPWGNTGNSPGGYHLVWTRDMVEAALGLLAAGQVGDTQRVLTYLAATQSEDGCWRQNFYPDGRSYWGGIQLDETGFPILLAAKLRELGVWETAGAASMVCQAAAYLARVGPVSPQDRWEEDSGQSPFTLAIEVAALVAAAAYYLNGQDREYALSLADCWNERIEEWTYVRDTPLSKQFDVDGYYVRLGPTSRGGGLRGRVEIKNRRGETISAAALIGLDFLYLARLGLRKPDDPRLLATLKIADALLRVETPCGPAYHRYNEDGYGEHEDGSPFDGTGIGRAWPLLTGERGHMALLQGQDPQPYLEAMACMTGPGGLIPEQVWDGAVHADKSLFPGKPSGSAMPLAWAHAEFLKLLVASERGRPVELLDAVWQRYQGQALEAATWHWRSDVPFSALPRGRSLLIENQQPFMLHLGVDGWQRVEDKLSAPVGLGMHGVRVADAAGSVGRMLNFTFFYPEERRWEGRDYTLDINRQ
jgi:glucoamylase